MQKPSALDLFPERRCRELAGEPTPDGSDWLYGVKLGNGTCN
jgi:hypothetical protein